MDQTTVTTLTKQVAISLPDKITRLQNEPHKVGYIGAAEALVIRVVHISDTHGLHNNFQVPDGDILIHSGDFFDWNDSREFEDQLMVLDQFFAAQPHKHKIFVAGNHELKFAERTAEEIQSYLPHVTYLQDSSVSVDGLLIYGSPWTGSRTSPAYAYTTPYSELGQKHWSLIPRNTDVLVTHSPPYKILDHKGALGSKELRKSVLESIRPLAHLFGHAHCNAVVVEIDGILFSNGSQCHYGTPAIIDIYVARS